ncbi:MAG: 50S ribosomal protein L24 [Christensenellales bacterium]|jgi:large subunit ribosomal protein L24
MAKLNVKKGDPVIIISGRDKGKSGQIVGVDRDKGRVFVEGDKNIKRVVKHVKPRKAQDKGGRIEQPASLDASNVMIVCSACNLPTRVGHKITQENDKDVKIRICKKCGASLDISAAKQKSAAKKTAKRKKSEAKVDDKALAVEENIETAEIKTEKSEKTAKPKKAVKASEKDETVSETEVK